MCMFLFSLIDPRNIEILLKVHDMAYAMKMVFTAKKLSLPKTTQAEICGNVTSGSIVKMCNELQKMYLTSMRQVDL